MPQDYFTEQFGPPKAHYPDVSHVANGKSEFLNCFRAALRAKMRNPKDVKIHVIPSLGGAIFPHVFWEETGKNGKRYFKDFWHDEKTFGEAAGYKNKFMGRETDALRRAPINFKGHVRNNVSFEMLFGGKDVEGKPFKGMVEQGMQQAGTFHNAMLRAAKRNRRGIYGALAALALGDASDHAMNRVIAKDPDYKGYRGGVGKNVGTAAGLLAGVPVGLHLGLLPGGSNMLNHAVRNGTARPRDVVPRFEGKTLKAFGERLNGMLNGSRHLPKGKARALAAALAATGVAVPTVLGRMAGRTVDSKVKAVSYLAHKAREKKASATSTALTGKKGETMDRKEHLKALIKRACDDREMGKQAGFFGWAGRNAGKGLDRIISLLTGSKASAMRRMANRLATDAATKGKNAPGTVSRYIRRANKETAKSNLAQLLGVGALAAGGGYALSDSDLFD